MSLVDFLESFDRIMLCYMPGRGWMCANMSAVQPESIDQQKRDESTPSKRAAAAVAVATGTLPILTDEEVLRVAQIERAYGSKPATRETVFVAGAMFDGDQGIDNAKAMLDGAGSTAVSDVRRYWRCEVFRAHSQGPWLHPFWPEDPK